MEIDFLGMSRPFVISVYRRVAGWRPLK